MLSKPLPQIMSRIPERVDDENSRPKEKVEQLRLALFPGARANKSNKLQHTQRSQYGR